MTSGWVKEQIDDLEAEEARVSAMAEQEKDTWVCIAFKERLGQIRQHLRPQEENVKPEEHIPSVLWSKKQQRWVGACRCGFYVIGNQHAQADEGQIRQNLQLHLSKHKIRTKETESAG